MSDKRTQIIEASIDLFASRGFWNTPTSRITRHAAVSTGTLFNYFASKEGLIDEVYLQLRQEQAAHIARDYPAEATVQRRMEHIWFRYIDWGARHPIRYRLLRQMKLSDSISEAAQQRSLAELSFALAAVEQGIAEGLFPGLDAAYFTTLVVAQLEAAVSHAIDHVLQDLPLTRHIIRAFEIFWNGVTR